MTGAMQEGEPDPIPPRGPDRRVLRLGLLGAVTMFLVHPPADLWMLAWLAPGPVADPRGTASARRVIRGGACGSPGLSTGC